MSDWNPDLYLKFKKERTQPAIDLANRIKDNDFKNIADIGCGPGNSTAVLKAMFPNADLTGIDNSQSMIDKAKAAHSDINFKLCDIHALDSGYDLLYSNACLQWIPNHYDLLPELMSKLTCGSMLAVQIPINQNEPLFKIIDDAASDKKWGIKGTCFETNKALSPDEYYDILSSCTSDFNIWETVYYHTLQSHRALIDWVKGTRLRPYLDALSAEKAEEFESEIVKRASEVYPVRENGNVVLRFRRLFFTAQK